MANTFGHLFRITTWGESHGGAVGVVVDGCPPRLPLTEADLQPDLDRRRPGQSKIVSPRKESDTVQILSGECEFSLAGQPHPLKTGDLVYMPPNLVHAVKATKQFSMLLTLFKPEAAAAALPSLAPKATP